MSESHEIEFIPEAADHDDLVRRYKKLEAENKKLKREINFWKETDKQTIKVNQEYVNLIEAKNKELREQLEAQTMGW